MALNSVFSFIKMSDRDLKFVYLFCQTDTFLFVIETPIRKCKHPFSRNGHLQNVEHSGVSKWAGTFTRLRSCIVPAEITEPPKLAVVKTTSTRVDRLVEYFS